MRLSQPTRATQLKIQVSSAWPDTWLWLNTMCFFGSMPAAMKAAVDLAGVAGKLRRAAPDVHALRDRVHVDDAIDAVMRLLQLHEIDDRAEVIAEMQIAGRLDARKNPFNEGHGLVSRCSAPSFAMRALRAQVAP